MTTMEIEHDAGNIHLTKPMQDGAQHPYRVAMTDGGAAIVMPENTTWLQSIVFNGMPLEQLGDTDTMNRMFKACWDLADCCRGGMNDMRMMVSTAGGGTSAGTSDEAAGQMMTGQMTTTIVCGSCTITLTM